jgi:hypothetical protein
MTQRLESAIGFETTMIRSLCLNGTDPVLCVNKKTIAIDRLNLFVFVVGTSMLVAP